MALEFNWNGNYGYVGNNSKYQLLYVQPVFSFNYKVITYSSDPAVSDIFIKFDGTEFVPTSGELAELDAYIAAHALPDPYAPRNLPEFRGNTYGLVGTGLTEIQTHSLITPIWDTTTQSVKNMVEMSFLYDVFTTGNQARLVPFSVSGLANPVEFSVMSLDGWTISGGSAVKTHTYRLDLTKRTSDDLLLTLNGSSNGDMVVRVELKLITYMDLTA